ncbi:MAG: fluoride efflux transporter CrcB [Pseudomonadota bacterium]
MTVAIVALGGALGAVMRYLLTAAAFRWFGPGFPWGTLGVNVVGSFAMGVLGVLLMERLPGSWRAAAPFALTGVLGGFTTFSAFSLDVWLLLERGRTALAAAYAGSAVVLSVAALALGVALARSVAS